MFSVSARILRSALNVFAVLVAGSGFAQEIRRPEAGSGDVGPNGSPPAVPSLENEAEVAGLIAQAKERATARSLPEALAAVEKFRRLKGETAPYFELKGTVLTLCKEYEKAEKAFTDLLALAPDSYVGRFNRAETIMLQGRYAKAESEFAMVEEDCSSSSPPIADLARFKRVACFLSLGKLLEASALVPPIQEAKESPALYYSRAMVAWGKKDAAGANRLLSEAREQFSRQVDDLYTDTFVELQWGARGADGVFNFGLKFR